MAARSESAYDYSEAARNAVMVEEELAGLLDELVISLEKGHDYKNIESKAALLADEASRLAGKIQGADGIELNELAINLDNLSERSADLIAKLPDALIANEQERWSAELERISIHLHDMKGSLKNLYMPNLSAADRRKHEKKLAQSFLAARDKIKVARAHIKHKEHAKNHPVHANLHRLRNAIAGVKTHISMVSVQIEGQRQQAQVQKAQDKIKSFLQTELEGRIFVDADIIQLRSALTGKIMEFTNDSVHAQALEAMFEGTKIMEMVPAAKRRKFALSAKFECVNDANGLVANIWAGERAIVGGTIMFTPVFARINL